ncbi:MAG: hypothetical protein OEZ20_10665 [candidate division WOR-3 bacterium]|nr:hypothetical protein [candidate division WOR-3 bacterium]MDH5684916.1 hypothetical protein [candidate division WOR-3 bacterium]
MESGYIDFRYLQLKKTPSAAKCALISVIAGIGLSFPYLIQIFCGTTSYVKIQPYHDYSGIVRCQFWLSNPYGFNFSRYLDHGLPVFATDAAIFLMAILLWTSFTSILLNEEKKRWQIFPLTITFGFTIPILVFTLSMLLFSRTLMVMVGFLNNPISIYVLLILALSFTFGLKKLMYLMIPGLFGYFIGFLLLTYIGSQISNYQFEKFVPAERIANWLTLTQISKNLIWNFFLGIGMYATYAKSRKISESFARFENSRGN